MRAGLCHVADGNDRRTARRRRAAAMAMAAVLPVTAIAAAAVPIAAAAVSPSAAGYTVTATVPVGSEPSGVAVDPATRTAYVTNNGDNTVSVIDEATNTVTATIAGGAGGAGFLPDGVAVDPATATVYVADYGDGEVADGTVSVIDAATNTVTATVPVGSEPSAVAVDPATRTAYVTNNGDNTVSVISAVRVAPVIVSPSRATFRTGRHDSFTVRASGIPAPSVSEAGKLPPGIRFTAGTNGTASIAGTPAAKDRGRTYAITLTARNGAGRAATQRFTLTVR